MQTADVPTTVVCLVHEDITAMRSQGRVTTASLKQPNKEYVEGHSLSACISKSSAHPSLKLRTVN